MNNPRIRESLTTPKLPAEIHHMIRDELLKSTYTTKEPRDAGIYSDTLDSYDKVTSLPISEAKVLNKDRIIRNFESSIEYNLLRVNRKRDGLLRGNITISQQAPRRYLDQAMREFNKLTRLKRKFYPEVYRDAPIIEDPQFYWNLPTTYYQSDAFKRKMRKLSAAEAERYDNHYRFEGEITELYRRLIRR